MRFYENSCFSFTSQFFVYFCSETKEIGIETRLPKTNAPTNLFHQPDAVILLEITSNFETTPAWIKGKILNFRLYSDGLVEFDDCPFESGKKILAEKSCDRKQIKITESEVKEVEILLLNKEFRNLKHKHSYIESSRDAILYLTIKAKNKIIEISWYDNLTDSIRPTNFPAILSKVLQQNRKIKNSTMGKEIISP